jgi:diadenylate cyclase
VIIRNDLLMAAGCYLPLSDNLSISKDLGTRHRAGIGMSEISDAVIVIVSEETGQISLAIQGNLERALSEEELVARLAQELKPFEKHIPFFFHREEKRRVEENIRYNKWIQNNWVLRLISVAIAIVMWFSVSDVGRS